MKPEPAIIFPVGTQVVALSDVPGSNGQTLHPSGAVGVVVKSASDLSQSYGVRFADGFESSLKSAELTTLAKFKEGEMNQDSVALERDDLFVGHPSSSRRDDMAVHSRGAVIDQRRAQEDQLLQRRGQLAFVGPQGPAEVGVRVARALHLVERVGERCAGELGTDLHRGRPAVTSS